MTEFFVDDERSLVRAPHQGEASWTAVVLCRFWVARTVPASRQAVERLSEDASPYHFSS
jgi:hypothetical protein